MLLWIKKLYTFRSIQKNFRRRDLCKRVSRDEVWGESARSCEQEGKSFKNGRILGKLLFSQDHFFASLDIFLAAVRMRHKICKKCTT